MTDKLLNPGGRDEQQDACDIFTKPDSILLVLGDGMGGHSGGQVASETLIAEAEHAYNRQQIIKNPKEFFQGIIDGTMSALIQYKKENPYSDPHTTCVLALIQNNKLFVGHIGDSRMYLFINKKFQIRSRDHSVVQMLLNEGEITEEEMATHPDQNKLLKSISARKKVKITFKEYDLPVDKHNAVLICSDGFWEQISVEKMESQLFKRPLGKALNTMVNTAKIQGGSDGDNISVVTYIQKGSKLALLRDPQYISKLKNIFILVIVTLLLVAGAVFYLKSNKTPQPSKENNFIKAKKVHKLATPIASPKVETKPHIEVKENKADKNISDLKSDKVVITPPLIKQVPIEKPNEVQSEKTSVPNLDKNDSAKTETKQESNGTDKNAT